ncbi:conserved Plasmodium protein, unknown function [Plasmodium ovale]|uniref:Uncharacterized protein n=1 Tax=Plasmodium ovale TaxID=36330 RepID=A0A1D3U9N8_PLAOA|nr:conserved Plasmodium protein, unknown function [Plasmodium ovale]
MSCYIFLFLALFYMVYGQIPYEVQEIYKPLRSQSVNAMPGDNVSADFELKEIKHNTEKEYAENSLRKLAERYHKEVEEMNQNILEELDQLIDIMDERSLYFTIF